MSRELDMEKSRQLSQNVKAGVMLALTYDSHTSRKNSRIPSSFFTSWRSMKRTEVSQYPYCTVRQVDTAAAAEHWRSDRGRDTLQMDGAMDLDLPLPAMNADTVHSLCLSTFFKYLSH